MKIGIFGDSYAEQRLDINDVENRAWWRKLAKDHGHQVTSFGVGGSSILYSAELLRKHHQEFDFNIWCMTTPGRFSIPIPGQSAHFHSNRVMDTSGTLNDIDPGVKIDPRVIDACSRYLKYVFDWDTENLIGRALAHYFLGTIPNLMIIPCFITPLDQQFNLYELCRKELEPLFPGKDVYQIYESYDEARACHLTDTNNSRLAALINADLRPGVFQTQYSNFCFDDIKLQDVLRPR